MIYAPLTRREPVADQVKLHQALAALLWELHEVLSGLTPEQYRQKPVGPVSASVGGHVRHSLDHIECALHSGELDDVDYDHRSRGTPVENDCGAALSKIEELLAALVSRESDDSPGESSDRPLTLSAMVSAGEGNEGGVTVQTTADRELLFAFSHTLHHNALIRVMVELLGGQVPERFGYAPATLAFMDAQVCAR